MKMMPSDSVTSYLLEGCFSGQAEFAEVIRTALVTAAVQGWREIILCDPDFEDWPLGERVVVQALNDWAKTGRKLTMLAENFAELPRRHARFVVWRRTWAHIVECQQAEVVPAGSLPSALWSPSWVFERQNLPRYTGTVSAKVVQRVGLKERLNELLLNSATAFPATTLGL